MDNDKKQYISLLTANYCRISSYISCLVPNHNDSEDIMQETTSLMWEKFNTYQPGTDFLAWSLAIARYKVLSYRRDKARSRLQFDENVMDLIDNVSKNKQYNEQSTAKISFLKECIRKLTKSEYLLISLKYSQNYTNKKLAGRTGVSVNTISRHLARIYHNLSVCVNYKMRSVNE
ncbi:MAG: sigma-70 family RNA polymerase sigma factor [Sedimentisphaerales bacterium]|nr:sigma-70 family RNA polymerase sigma factor [Sedimentisphaerales bacterium]MBN2844147.1 sigma-70 family RNA polymerase sigma factor [Sedimentisphaerales bacterium]